MAAHMYLKNEFTEDKKCHNLMSWLKWGLSDFCCYCCSTCECWLILSLRTCPDWECGEFRIGSAWFQWYSETNLWDKYYKTAVWPGSFVAESPHRMPKNLGSILIWALVCFLFCNVSSNVINLKWQLKEFDIHMSRDMTKPTERLCAQRRLWSAWASAQSDQSLRGTLNG